ncbi:MAG TPA: GNAT family N-acetyltransferase [Actinomycetota bacterium]|nr:GNAT family N-acetyltransferase [Actinomycetota bacterium]
MNSERRPDLSLRRSEKQDARAVTPLILAAAPSLEVVLRDRATADRAAEAAFRAERTVWSHRFGLAAEDGNGPVGLVTAFPGRMYGSLALGTGVVLARAAGARHASDLARRGRILQRLLAPIRRQVLYVSALAVLPDRRGRGIGTALIQRVLVGAERLGLGVALDAGVEDEAALRLYERLGFQRVDTRRTTQADRGLINISGLVRLERTL